MIILVFLICCIIFAISNNRLDSAKDKWINNFNIGGIYEPPFVWSLLNLISITVGVFSIIAMIVLKSN